MAREKPAIAPEPAAKSGMEGAVAARTAISRIDGEAGTLSYRGYQATELAARRSWEEVAYLLWHGELPARSELQSLREQMETARRLPPPLERLIDDLPGSAAPMDVLRTAASALGSMLPGVGAPTLEQAVTLCAQLPVALARFHRRRLGKEPLSPRPGLSHAALYLYLLTGEEPGTQQAEALNSYLVLLADHGLNASTFTARVIASTRADMYGALTGAVAALKGPLHGGAPSLVLDMLDSIGSAENAEPWLRAAIARGDRLMGFGHRVYRTTDPRAVALHEIARNVGEQSQLAFAEGVEELALRLLEEAKPGRRLYTNVEYYSAAVLNAVGLPRDLFTATFAISRTAGWSAHVLEQTADNRLIRPESEYIGSVERALP